MVDHRLWPCSSFTPCILTTRKCAQPGAFSRHDGGDGGVACRHPPPAGRRFVIRGTPYRFLLPKLSDPRHLHLGGPSSHRSRCSARSSSTSASSIVQILISLVTCALLEVGNRVRTAARGSSGPASADAHGQRRSRSSCVFPVRRTATGGGTRGLVDLRRHGRGCRSSRNT